MNSPVARDPNEKQCKKGEGNQGKCDSDWISIDKERPEAVDGNKVLGFGAGYAFECEFDDGYWCNLGGEIMTHWMPFEPPKGEDIKTVMMARHKRQSYAVYCLKVK